MSAHAANDLDFLTTSEAALVAGAEVRFVNRFFDEDILPESMTTTQPVRLIRSGACVFVRFYSETENILTAEERRAVIRHFCNSENRRSTSWRVRDWIKSRPKWTYRHAFMTLEFDSLIESTLAGHQKLAKARTIVVHDPKVLGGEPVIQGTRIPVYDVAASAQAGLSLADIGEDYPSLDEEKMELAIFYAKANPRRGRPASGSKRQPDTKSVHLRRPK